MALGRQAQDMAGARGGSFPNDAAKLSKLAPRGKSAPCWSASGSAVDDPSHETTLIVSPIFQTTTRACFTNVFAHHHLQSGAPRLICLSHSYGASMTGDVCWIKGSDITRRRMWYVVDHMQCNSALTVWEHLVHHQRRSSVGLRCRQRAVGSPLWMIDDFQQDCMD